MICIAQFHSCSTRLNLRNLVPRAADGFVNRHINELLQKGSAKSNTGLHRQQSLLLQTIAGEISDFLRALIPLGFYRYVLLSENGFF